VEECQAKERQRRRIKAGAVVGDESVEDGSYTESAGEAEEGIDTIPAELGGKRCADKEQHQGDIGQGRFDDGSGEEWLD
jgi:hypothetical protein